MTFTIYTLLMTAMRQIDDGERYFREKIPIEIMDWIFYFSWVPIALAICSTTSFIQTTLAIPIYAWKLFWHPDGRSIFAILSDPCGHDSPSTHLPLSCSNEIQPLHRFSRRRETPRFQRRHNMHSSRIVGYDSELCLFSFYQMNRENMNRCEHGSPQCDDSTVLEAARDTCILTEYCASTFFSACKIHFGTRPLKPPDGFFAALFVMGLAVCFYSIFTFFGVWNIISRKPSWLRTKKKRRKRSQEAIRRKKARRRLLRAKLASPSEGERVCPADTCIPCSEGARDTSSILANVTSLADVDTETLNTQVPFDTASIFFVCDNSTTGHICNDISKFVPGTLRQTARRLTTANGTGPCLKEGTVQLSLRDDDGKLHKFILDDCIYHPDSPVNLLSTSEEHRRLI